MPHHEKRCQKCPKKGECYCPAGVSLANLNVVHHTVEVDRTYPPDGTKLNLNVVQSSSNTGGRDILMVHGYPHAWPIYKNQLMSELSENNNMYAMDVRGFGESDAANPDPAPGPGDLVWNVNTLARDFRDVIVKLGLVKPIIIVHSLSGTQIADFFRVFGDRGHGGVGGDGAVVEVGGPKIGGLVILDSFPVVDPATYFTPETIAIVQSGGFFTNHFEKLLPTVQAFGKLSTYCTLKRPEFGELAQYDTFSSLGGRIGALSIPPPADQNDPVWRSLCIKTLIVYGEKDEVIKINAAEKLHELIRRSKLDILPCVGHIPQYEDPKRLNCDIQKFIDHL